MPIDARVDAYIARQADFAQPILREIRARVHAACPDVGEAMKWSMPFFVLRGRPLANMAGFKAHASFGFWARDAMATGKEGDAMGQFGRLTSIADLPPEREFAALIRQAAAHVEAGPAQRAGKVARPEAEIPPDLAEALAGDAAAAATFRGFPPGARREYCEWIADAKRPATRKKRLADTIAWLREGKRRNWKYENC
ncbi:YdeI/OmpD-associated family protein [Sphingosinithalassobacter portus]|uniref:YdeI/OmpD-associated family protein n=1 Tax=Stakelama portus TaxID=2676234 RepID=UPI000D6E4C8C|nr:YdeI/OmpD-associated family protein [Sphingosinithalassobacter portus]